MTLWYTTLILLSTWLFQHYELIKETQVIYHDYGKDNINKLQILKIRCCVLLQHQSPDIHTDEEVTFIQVKNIPTQLNIALCEIYFHECSQQKLNR